MNGEDLSEANKESKYLKAFHTLNESKKILRSPKINKSGFKFYLH